MSGDWRLSEAKSSQFRFRFWFLVGGSIALFYSAATECVRDRCYMTVQSTFNTHLAGTVYQGVIEAQILGPSAREGGQGEMTRTHPSTKPVELSSTVETKGFSAQFENE